jgi:solute carrier family 35 protein F5
MQSGKLLLQSIFEAYKHPFVLTYLGAALLVVYLPISFLKDYICDHIQRRRHLTHKSLNLNGIRMSSLPGSPMRSAGVHKTSDLELEKLIFKKESGGDATDPESAHPFALKASSLQALKDSAVLTTWEIAKMSLFMAPLWFVTEVGMT